MIPLFRRAAVLFLALMLLFATACARTPEEPEEHPAPKKNTDSPKTEKTVTIPLLYEAYGQTIKNAEESWQHIRLGSTPLEMQYRELSSALDSINQKADEKAEAEIRAFTENAEAVKKKFGIEFFPGDVYNRYTYLPRRADTHIVSLIKVCEKRENQYTSSTWFETCNLDTATGKLLKITDVFSDFGRFVPTLAQDLKEKYTRVWFYNDDINLRITELYKFGDLGFTVDYDGITFYFNPDTVAATRYGMMTVSYPYERIRDRIKEEYLDIPDTYIVWFSDSVPVYRNLTYKATSDNVLGNVDRFKLTYEDETVDLRKINWPSFRTYLVHLGPGNEYVYIDIKASTGYGSLLVYHLTSSGPKESGTVENKSFFALEMGDNEPVGIEMFTSPERFKLGVRCDLLATSVATALYKFGKDGLPALLYEDSLYDIDSLHEYTLRSDIRDADGVLLKEGTTFIFVRTDFEDKVVIMTGDGLEHTVLLSTIDVKRDIDGIEYAT